uniref:hypothetical protein n=1 Tax=Pseudomonas sp. KCJK8927 TaxID=3344560 RepID=UPI003906633D
LIVVVVAVFAAIGVHVAQELLALIAEQPLGAFVRVADVIQMALDIVVVPGTFGLKSCGNEKDQCTPEHS